MCKAFKLIPLNIWEGKKHNKPIKGQKNKIVFEKKKEVENE